MCILLGMNTKNPYLMVYKHGFIDIAPKLTKSELRIFAHIFNNTNFGNICYESQKDIAKQLKMYSSHVSAGVRNLIHTGLMTKYRKGFMLNPEYCVLGPMEDKPKLHAMYSNLEVEEVDAPAE